MNILNDFFSNKVENLDIARYSDNEPFLYNIKDSTQTRHLFAIKGKRKRGKKFKIALGTRLGFNYESNSKILKPPKYFLAVRK